jgi:OOP family OmpA-OmpF porin
MKKATCLFFISVFILASSSYAQVKPKTYSFTPFIGGYSFDSEENLETKPVFGVRLGYDINQRWGIEGVFDYLETEYDRASIHTDAKVYGYRLEALYHFMPENRLVPFVAAGLGGRSIHYDQNVDNKSDFLFDYGAGFKYFFSDRKALRGDVRHLIVTDDSLNNFEYGLGLSFYFGGPKQPVAKPVLDSDHDGVTDDFDKCPNTPTGVKVDLNGCPLDTDKDGVLDYLDKCPGTPIGVKVDLDGCPLDTDKDGVLDYLDKCPGTPIGVKVDSDGCPLDTDKDGVLDYLDKCPGTLIGVKVDQDGCPLDTDKDGVADYLDKCPGTPLGVKVDADGCPLDTDKDGVPDYLDKCPGTPAGVKVDQNGCEPPVAKELLEKGRATINIEFDTNKADVKPKYQEELQKFADVMKAYPKLKVIIEGHTDNVGAKDYNQQLSAKRAESVKNYLIKTFGIEESRLTSKGYGISKPIADNKTKQGRQQNRRVEAVVDSSIQ